MNLTRNLSLGDAGADVRAVKDLLFALGYYHKDVKAITKDSFGNDTDAAVRAFQRANLDENGKALKVDGIVGKATFGALERAAAVWETPIYIPNNIGPTAKSAIENALRSVNQTRRAVTLLALGYAYDAETGRRAYPISLYIRGENLFDKSLRQVVITKARVESGAKAQPQYYSNGRKEMMLAAVQENPAISGADCSGGVVGILRRFGLVKPSFDATANTLCGSAYSRTIRESELVPGDFVGRPEHIGIYAGGGYVVEWTGGAYGCQLTKLSGRQAYDFVRQRVVNQSKWTKFRRPKLYP